MTAAAAPSMDTFTDRNGRFAGGKAVHAVAPQPWIGDLHVPGPACHTPSGTFDPADFRPVRDEVTCRRCLKNYRSRAVVRQDDPDQLDALALLAELDNAT